MGLGFRKSGISDFRRGAMLAALLATTALASFITPICSPAYSQTSGETRFDIPAGPLSRTLATFGRQAGVQLSYEAAIASGKSSQGLSGMATREQAISRILQGTGLSYSFSDRSNVLISRPGAAASIAAGAGGELVLDTINVEGNTAQGFVASASTFGTKTSTPLIETPQTINVVTRSQIELQAPQNVMQALKYTPGVNAEWLGPVNMGEDHYVNARGFELPTYVDGLRAGGGFTGAFPSVDPYLVERLDVLKGPASTLYGTTPPGGLVNITSKRPTEAPLREVEFQTGSYGRAQASFDVGGPVDDKGQFLYRLTGTGHTAGTQFGNDTKDQLVAIAPAFTWRPDADTSLTVLGRYQYVPNIQGYQFLPAVGTVLPNPNGRIPYRLFTGDRSVDDSWFQQASVGYEFKHKFSPDWELRQNFRYENFRSQQLFVYAFGFYPGDPSLQTANRYSLSRFSHYDRYDVDTQLEGRFETGPLRHNILIGFDYQRMMLDQKAGGGLASPLNLFSPVYRGAQYPVVSISSLQRSWQAGLYAQDQIKLGKFVLTLGGRYDWTEGETTDRVVVPNLKTTQRDGAFSGRVGLSYLSDIGLAPYVSYATSFEPVIGTDFNSKAFEPTTGRQLEAGIKYQPIGYNAFLQASVFDITQQNVQTSDPQHIGFSIQTGQVRSRGFEIEGRASLTEGLDLILSYAHLDTKVTRSNGDDLGKELTQAPSDTAAAFLAYTINGGPFAGLTLGGGVRYVGEAFGTSSNVWDVSTGIFAGTPSKIPAYTLVDALLKYDFGVRNPSLKGLQLQVNANNLFNKEYVAACTGSANSCYYGSARTVYATLRYRF